MIFCAFNYPRVIRFATIAILAVPVFGGAGARAQTYTLSTLVNFNGTNGAGPYAGLTPDSRGDLFGATSTGGDANYGTVFEIPVGTNTLSPIATFTASTGYYPEANLTLDSSGDIYGTTFAGGADSHGTVFEIAAGTSTISTIASFTGANGEAPLSSVVFDASGDMYGTTSGGGGASNDGTVFEIAAGTNTITTLATFTGTNGRYPMAGLTIDSSGNLYGTTEEAGSGGAGTAFKIAAGTHSLSTLVNFNTNNGANPVAALTLDSAGNLYGTGAGGGSGGQGTVFKIAVGSNTLTTLATFTGSNGADPEAPVVLDSSGNLYGTTSAGGTDSAGTVFKIATGTNALTTLATFTSANGQVPSAGVTLSSTGSIYGTTQQGGEYVAAGTVFELTPAGSAATPEPGALALWLPVGLPALAAVARRRRKAAGPAAEIGS